MHSQLLQERENWEETSPKLILVSVSGTNTQVAIGLCYHLDLQLLFETFFHEDVGTEILRNNGILPHHYTVS
jgi:hypothetical protein